MSPKKEVLRGTVFSFVSLFIHALPDGKMDNWLTYILACAGCAAFFGILLFLYDKYGRKQVIKRRYGAPEHDCRYIFDSTEICCTECGRRWKVKRWVSLLHFTWGLLTLCTCVFLLFSLPPSLMKPFAAMGHAGEVVFLSLCLVVVCAVYLAGIAAINTILRKVGDLSQFIGKEVFPED